MVRCWLVGTLLVGALTSAAPGLGTPESVFLVVNSDSWASKSVANHYIRLRGIPDQNVFHLPWRHGVEWVDLATFRQELIGPILAEIRSRDLLGQIRYIVYSSDFPFAVDFSARAAPGTPFPQGSLTGMTFLYASLGDPKLGFAELDANGYALAAAKTGKPLGFERYLETERNSGGTRSPPFYLSFMLGYSAGRGNSLAEIISYLRAAATADASHPQGEFCFMANGDIRSQARSGRFPGVVASLKKLGARAVELPGDVPPGPRDISGAVLGRSDFSWNPSARILPGAICENFTSYGGIMSENAQQTPLTELLRQGASGSSGTVVEPYAIPLKFPDPAMHIHYRLGATMGEAFYLAVPGPYQLLMVGDPLCRPWGVLPQVELRDVQSETPYQEALQVTPQASAPQGVTIAEMRVYLDGRFLQAIQPGQSFTINPSAHPSGEHRLTVAAIDKSPLAYVGRRVIPVRFQTGDASVEWKFDAPANLPWGSLLKGEVASTDCDEVEIRSQGRVLARVDVKTPQFSIDTRRLGMGPVRLTAVGRQAGNDICMSPGMEIRVGPPRITASETTSRDPRRTMVPGLAFRGGAGLTQSVTATTPANWLEALGVPSDGGFSLSGLIRIEEADVYQFRGDLRGKVTLKIAGKVVYRGDAGGIQFGLPLHFRPGSYPLQCDVQLAGPARARLEFDHRGSKSLSSTWFQHSIALEAVGKP